MQKTTKASLQERFHIYISHHKQACLESIARLLKTPFATFMVLAVLAIALALPTGLWVALKNLKSISKEWDKGAQISLFLKMDVDEIQVQQLIERLRIRPEIAQATYISPDEGLQSFQKQAGMSVLLAQLPRNPLPGVVEVTPNPNYEDPVPLRQLLASLQGLTEVDQAQVDLEWVKRLYHLIKLGQHSVSALALLFGIAVLLIIGNTLRLLIQNRRDEIAVIKMVGGSDRFIRRPFLYGGILYGLCSGLLAGLLVNLALWWLNAPLQQLAQSYGSVFTLAGLSFGNFLQIAMLGALLGALGAWLAVAQQLHTIKPGEN